MSPPDIQIEVFGKTDVGLIREHNEDNLLVADLGGSLKESDLDAPVKLTLGAHGALFLVCDGMGGAAAGEVASQMAVDAIFDVLAAADPMPREAFARELRRAVEAANERIFQQSRDNQNERGMGTTCTAAALTDDTLIVAQIGDSRCYVFRRGHLGQVTKDQSLAWQLIEAGAMTPEDAKAFEHANIILQALGVQDRVDVVMSQVLLRKGDVVILCSDGLHGPVSDQEMQDILTSEPDLKKAGEGLLQKALERDGPDNITVVLARFDGAGLVDPTPDDRVGFMGYDIARDEVSESGVTPEPDTGGEGSGPTSIDAPPVTAVRGDETTEETNIPNSATSTTTTTATAKATATVESSDEPPVKRRKRRVTFEAPARGGRSVMALFFLALLAAVAGGIFVLKCERDQAVSGESPRPRTMTATSMSCVNCGSDLEDGARFCGACGTRVEADAPAESSGVRSLDAPPSSIVSANDSKPSRSPEPPTMLGRAKPVAANSASLNPALETTMLTPPVTSPAGSSGSRARPGLWPSATPAAVPAPSVPARVPAPAPVPAFAPLPVPAVAVTGGRTERRSENSGSRDDMVGRTLNKRYVVGDKVGEGGFGAVFRGKQLATGREVALKILHPYNLGDPTIVARFRREAEACSRLRNTHTVITYDFDETEDGVLYLAMEMLRGKSLHHLQRAEGTLNPDRVLSIIDQVAEALGEAHQNGIVHRDMKPENVFVERRGDDDYVKVLDFGIAKMMSDDRGQAALTAVGQTLGTLEFMSPEQLRGLPLDGRSDIYALGIMAYEMLTGELAVQGREDPRPNHQFSHAETRATALAPEAEPPDPRLRR